MESFYYTMLNNINKQPYLKKIIIKLSKYTPIITFIIYPSVILYLLILKSPLLFETIFHPLIAFILVTILRKIINRKRPYERMNITPLVHHKQGESFPSRHTVSAFAIAFACLKVNTYLGIIMLIIACIIACSRILCGVHYISDVISAIAIAYIISFIEI